MRRKLGLIGAVVAITAVGLLAWAPGAQAAFDAIKVREVFGGSTMSPSSDFVELQMYSPGQNLVNNHCVTTYDTIGVRDMVCFAANVGNGANQATILLATPMAAAEFGVAADLAFMVADPVDSSGGAACWDALDCVSWGVYPGVPPPPSPTGTPAAPAGLPPDQSVVRTIARGCVTALDPADDTNDSAADLSLTMTPTPRPNTMAPADVPCTSPPAMTPSVPSAGTPGKKKRVRRCKKKPSKNSASAAKKKPCKNKK